MSALEDRRQRAFQAGGDVNGWVPDSVGLRAAIEAATRVQITPEIKRAAVKASGHGRDIPDYAYDGIIEAAFRAAGFEVVE